MSEKFRLDRKIGFQNTFYTKCINVIIDSIGPSIILRKYSIYLKYKNIPPLNTNQKIVWLMSTGDPYILHNSSKLLEALFSERDQLLGSAVA